MVCSSQAKRGMKPLSAPGQIKVGQNRVSLRATRSQILIIAFTEQSQYERYDRSRYARLQHQAASVFRDNSFSGRKEKRRRVKRLNIEVFRGCQ